MMFPIFLCIRQYPAKRKVKNHEILAGFGGEFIDSKTSKKPVKSRFFRDLERVKNAAMSEYHECVQGKEVAYGRGQGRQLDD